MSANSSSALSRLCATAIVCTIAGVLSGCASAGYHKSDATARSLHDASREVQVEIRTLTLALQALDEIVNKPAADLKPQFQRFNKHLDSLIKEAERNDKADRDIEKRSTDYFTVWDKELSTMTYEVVRTKSQNRKIEAMKDFQSVHQRYLEAQGVMQPLLAYLEDIRKALRSDLTQHGVEALKPIAANANQNAEKVQSALNRLSSELSATGTRYSSFVFQTTGPGATSSAAVK